MVDSLVRLTYQIKGVVEMEMRYTIVDTKINVAYNNMSEYDVRMYAFRIGAVSTYGMAKELELEDIKLILNKAGHSLTKEDTAMGYKGKMSKQIIKNNNGPDVDIYFFELLEMNYSQLNDMLNDYLDLYNAFNDYTYRMNALIVMEAINTKKAKEVNVS